jgi:hypothetical protein
VRGQFGSGSNCLGLGMGLRANEGPIWLKFKVCGDWDGLFWWMRAQFA